MPQKDQWSQLEGRELTATEVVAPDWWKGFGDEYLNRLVDSAIQENLNLKIASARLDKAAIQLKKERFPLSPEVQSAPTSSIQRSKSETAPPITTRSTELLGATLSWEIDIWGKIRKGVLAEEVGYRGMEMDWRAAYLSLITNVAERYFQIRLFDEQITQQQASLQQSQSLLQIFEAQYREGLIPETRLLNQRSEINGLTKQLLDLQRARTESELRLATLLGKPAGTLEVPVANLSETIELVTVPLVLPADLLARRPDVLRAEYDLLQAHHLVGRARLARLPSFSLTASANTGSSLSDLLLNTWTFGLATSLAPLFDRNLKIDVPLNEAEVKVRIEQYRQVVLRAFEEVEVALLNLDSRLQQMQQLQQQIANLRIVQKVQQARLREGLVSQLEVFETERSLLNARKAILGEYQASLNETVRLYKALGGGWPPERPTDHSATVAAARGEK
jgi:NodT family efflux transporter outer membrane factor (OMF) lipoprotein